jgi:hypothetical protein
MAQTQPPPSKTSPCINDYGLNEFQISDLCTVLGGEQNPRYLEAKACQYNGVAARRR